MRKIMISLLILLVVLSSIQPGAYAEAREPVAKVNGKEIFLTDNQEEKLKNSKEYLEENGKNMYEGYRGRELEKKIQDHMDYWIRDDIENIVEDLVLKDKMEKEGFKGEISDFLEGKVNIRDEELVKYMEDNKDLIKAYSHMYWQYETKEDAENLHKKLQNKDLFKEVVESQKPSRDREERTYLDEFNDRSLRHRLSEGYEDTSTSSLRSFSEYNLIEGFNPDGDIIQEVEKEELKKLKLGEISNVVGIENEGYFIFSLLEERNMTKEEVREELENKEIKKIKEDIINEYKVEYLYPEIKIKLAEDLLEDRQVKIARVNGRDIYLDKGEFDILSRFEAKEKEKQKKAIIDNAINQYIIAEKAVEEGFAKSIGNSKDQENLVISYFEKSIDEIDITEEEVKEYIEENGGETYKIVLNTIRYEKSLEADDNESKISEEELEKKYEEKVNNLYEDLKKDDTGYRILKAIKLTDKGIYKLTDEERSLLSKYSPTNDFSISGMANYLSIYVKDMIEIDPRYADEIKQVKARRLGDISRPKKDDYGDYISTIIVEKTDDYQDVKEDIINILKYMRLEEIREEIFEGAEIKYY